VVIKVGSSGSGFGGENPPTDPPEWLDWAADGLGPVGWPGCFNSPKTNSQI